MEGVVLHVDDSGAPTTIICQGKGSFERTLKEVEKPSTTITDTTTTTTTAASSVVEEREEQPEAATV